MNQLPIEKDKELLSEYGRAFAWLSLVDTYLETLIWSRGKLLNADRAIIESLLERKTLGQKIHIAKKFLVEDEKLPECLSRLNGFRKALAHSSIATAFIDNGNGKEAQHLLLKNFRSEVVRELNMEFLNDVIVLAENISNRIHQIILNNK